MTKNYAAALKTLAALSLLFISGACNQSVKKDLSTGAYSRGDGIVCSRVYVNANGERTDRNVFVDGERIQFVFNNISGLAKMDGKVFPGLSVLILKNGTDTAMFTPDLLSDLKGTDVKPLQLRAEFLVNLPFQNKEKYKALIKIWDKKGKGTFIHELPFTVQKNELLKVKSNGLDYKKIYLWNENLKQVVANERLNSQHQYILIIENISGLKQVNEAVFPQLSLQLADKRGHDLIANPNMLEKFDQTGISPDQLAQTQLPVFLNFTPGKFFNPYNLKTSLTDKNSGKRIDIEAKLVIN